MQAGGDIVSWIGSPFGPDCFAAQLKVNYEPNDRWNLTFGYLFKIHGENTAENMFNPETKRINIGTEESPEWIWAHYPYAKYKYALEKGDEKGMEDSVKQSRYMWMSGTPEYTNRISLAGEYYINKHFNISGQIAYTFITNNYNIIDAFR